MQKYSAISYIVQFLYGGSFLELTVYNHYRDWVHSGVWHQESQQIMDSVMPRSPSAAVGIHAVVHPDRQRPQTHQRRQWISMPNSEINAQLKGWTIMSNLKSQLILTSLKTLWLLSIAVLQQSTCDIKSLCYKTCTAMREKLGRRKARLAASHKWERLTLNFVMPFDGSTERRRPAKMYVTVASETLSPSL